MLPLSKERRCVAPLSDGIAARLCDDVKWAGYENRGENDLPRSGGECAVELLMVYNDCKNVEVRLCTPFCIARLTFFSLPQPCKK